MTNNNDDDEDTGFDMSQVKRVAKGSGNAPDPKPAVPRMSEDELRKFVLGVCDGRIVTSNVVPGYLLPLVFMPLGLAASDMIRTIDVDSVGLVWESLDAPGQIPGRAINGFPMFTSCHVMHKADVARVRVAVAAELKRRQRIKV
jgi:hypothetical protein